MSEGHAALCALLEAGQACVQVSVTRTAGSTPREAGARMLVTREALRGTVGGGRLEADAIADARTLLRGDDPAACGLVRSVRLGPELGQCCGGSVELALQRFCAAELPLLRRASELECERTPYAWVTHFEDAASGAPTAITCALVSETGECTGEGLPSAALREARARLAKGDLVPSWMQGASPSERVLFEPCVIQGLSLVVFGAGHVGRALLQVLAPLAWPIDWVDTRDDAFPPDVPVHVRTTVTDIPEVCVDEARPGSAFLIMTQDHGLDYRLCERVLTRPDALFCGLIGSETKRAKFLRRLRERGHDAATLSRLTCPIGLSGLGGKAPGEVAIAVAAQLLTLERSSRALPRPSLRRSAAVAPNETESVAAATLEPR